MFIKPEKFDFRVTTKNADIWAIKIADQIASYKWDNKKPIAKMMIALSEDTQKKDPATKIRKKINV